MRPVLAAMRPVLAEMRPVLAGMRPVLAAMRPVLAGMRPRQHRTGAALHTAVRAVNIYGTIHLAFYGAFIFPL